MPRLFRSRWMLVAACGITLLALWPQLHLWYHRGGEWQGANAYFYTDEPAYAAYVNALIDGRPRRNDPYTGEDDSIQRPLDESLFSIQFIPAYIIALPARALGISTATAFILLAPLSATVITLGLFWFLSMFIDDSRVCAAGVLIVLCLGLLISGHGLVRNLFRANAIYVYLPYLRRYSPVVPFCFFIFFFPLLWQSLVREKRSSRLLFVLGAAASFIVCVYGYFYLWTSQAALVLVLTVCWFAFRPLKWREGVESLILLAALGSVALVPYAMLLSHRSPTMDTVQALTHSHAPDLWRWIEFSALAVFVSLIVVVARGKPGTRDPRALFAATLSFVPFILFNQQILTGRSLQPMHYEQFVAPYLVLMSAVLTVNLSVGHSENSRRRLCQVMLVFAGLSFVWGAGETWIATRRFAAANVLRDEARPLAIRLRRMSLDGRDDRDGANINQRSVVFSTDYLRADGLPMVAPIAVLWSPHMFVFSGVTVAENKERFFQYLYYSGVEANEFVQQYQRLGFVQFAIFGWERANPKLTVNYKPVTDAELEVEAKNYRDYIEHFDRNKASHPALSYLLLPANQQSDFDSSHLDRWYARDEGERINSYVLYRLKLRQ